MARAWTGFWFTPEDPLTLGVLRVLVGGMLVYTHFVWGLNLAGFFGPDGWQSTEAVRGFFVDDWLPSFWWYVPVEHLRLVHLLCLCPLLMFAVGLWTPVTSVLALVITISNSNRAPLANYGMDQILSVLMLYLTIGACGDRFSLDAWRRRRSARRNLSPTFANWQPPATSRARLGTRLIQVHFCIIYFFSAISKLQGDAWWNGEAIWMAFANKEYQSIDMTWLAHYPWITQLATHATIYWELSFPFLIWNRTLRPFILLMGIGMHAGIGLCMGMITFGAIMIFGYLSFVPPETMQAVLNGAAGRLHGRTRPENVTPTSDTENEMAGTVVESSADADSPLTASVPDSTPSVEPSASQPNLPATSDRQVAPIAVELTGIPLAICDPSWKHREFALYLSRRGFHPFVSTSPARVWIHVEQHDLRGAILFVDRLDSHAFDLMLDDLTLSPIAELPIVIASQHESRCRRADALGLRHLRSIALPATFSDLRTAIESVLQTATSDPPAVSSQSATTNGHAERAAEPNHPTAAPADSSLEATR